MLITNLQCQFITKLTYIMYVSYVQKHIILPFVVHSLLFHKFLTFSSFCSFRTVGGKGVLALFTRYLPVIVKIWIILTYNTYKTCEKRRSFHIFLHVSCNVWKVYVSYISRSISNKFARTVSCLANLAPILCSFTKKCI